MFFVRLSCLGKRIDRAAALGNQWNMDLENHTYGTHHAINNLSISNAPRFFNNIYKDFSKKTITNHEKLLYKHSGVK